MRSRNGSAPSCAIRIPPLPLVKRGRDFALELEQGIDFPDQIERILADAAEKKAPSKSISAGSDAASAPGRFPLTLIAGATIAGSDSAAPQRQPEECNDQFAARAKSAGARGTCRCGRQNRIAFPQTRRRGGNCHRGGGRGSRQAQRSRVSGRAVSTCEAGGGRLKTAIWQILCRSVIPNSGS